ncbi:MAG: efflux RND transporter periplasmic adaptor subunit [Cytophagaceae bacterium]|jgi:membrane fusion protein (multidrug efflux system)|nr:efflux RND transporter periplasmic adaptor subunit [Cytophagaceae bacterium]
MKTKTIIVLVIFIVAAALIKWIFLSPEQALAARNGPDKGPVSVTGYILRSASLSESIRSSGILMAMEEMEWKPEVSGKIIYLFPNEGVMVNKGTLLAKINDAELQAQYEKLELQWKLATEKEKRYIAMKEVNGISQEELDQAIHQRESLQIDMELVRTQILKTEIRAPFSGKVGLRRSSTGSFVSAGTVLGSLQQVHPLKLDFSVSEKYAGLISVSDKVEFQVENVKGNLEGKVSAMEPRIDRNTGTITVRAVVNNAEGKLFPGAFANVQVVPSRKPNAILVPTEAIIPELKGKKVFIARQGKAVPVKIETGFRGESFIEVTSGLQAGDTLVRTGIMSIRPDSELKFSSITN